MLKLCSSATTSSQSDNKVGKIKVLTASENKSYRKPNSEVTVPSQQVPEPLLLTAVGIFCNEFQTIR